MVLRDGMVVVLIKFGEDRHIRNNDNVVIVLLVSSNT